MRDLLNENLILSEERRQFLSKRYCTGTFWFGDKFEDIDEEFLFHFLKNPELKFQDFKYNFKKFESVKKSFWL